MCPWEKIITVRTFGNMRYNFYRGKRFDVGKYGETVDKISKRRHIIRCDMGIYGPSPTKIYNKKTKRC